MTTPIEPFLRRDRRDRRDRSRIARRLLLLEAVLLGLLAAAAVTIWQNWQDHKASVSMAYYASDLGQFCRHGVAIGAIDPKSLEANLRELCSP